MRPEREVRRGAGQPRKAVKKVDHEKIQQSLQGKMQEKLEEVRKAGRNEAVNERRTSSRLAAQYRRDTKPTLSFGSKYKGVRTQILYAEQEIGFEQVAELEWDAGAPGNIASYFELRQYVCDEIRYAGYQSQVRAWELDGPYHPPYRNAQILAGKTSITFTDEPGFSSTGSSADNRKVVSGDWLELYTVSFYWEVTRLDTGRVWQSDVVTHTMTSPPNADWSNAPVNAVAAGNTRWEVDLPPG